MRSLFGMILLASAATAGADSLFGAAYLGGDARVFDARIEAKGGAGIAQRDSLNAATKSPTQLLDLKLVTLTFTGVLQKRDAQDGNGEISRSDLLVPSLRVGMPIGKRGGFGFGFSALRSTHWTTVAPSPQDSLVLETVRREGTQFVIPIELAFRVHEKLSLGAGLLYEGGTISTQWSADLSGVPVDPEARREDTSEAWTYELAAALHDLGPLQLGGYYVPEHDADVSIDLKGVARDANDDRKRSDTRPSRWGVGAGLEFAAGWQLVADYEFEQFSAYSGRSFRDENGELVGLNDESVWRAGIERLPARLARGLAGLPWRAGYYQREWNYDVGGEPLREWAVSLGTAILFRLPGARTDLSLSYGRIGDLDQNGAEESFLRLTFSVSGGEKWY